MTRYRLIEATAEAIARAERTDYGTMTFDWRHNLTGTERKHYREMARAAVLTIENCLDVRFERGGVRAIVG